MRESEGEAKRILYMEDNKTVAQLFQKKLEGAGYAVDLAFDGAEGLAKEESNTYDIIVVDHRMPEFEGLEIIRMLSEKGSPAPIIMITGDEEVAIEALKLGALDYVVKDQQKKYLELMPSVIEKALEQQNLTREKNQTQKALRRSEEYYRMIVEGQSELICRFLEGGELTFVNRSFCKYFDKPFEKIIGQNFFSLIPEKKNVKDKLDSLNENSPVFTFEHQVNAPNGEFQWQQWTVTIIAQEFIDAIEYQCVGRNISPLKEMKEEVINKNEELGRSIQDLKHSNQELQQFAYVAAHDLQAPLRSITQFMELLSIDYGDVLDETAALYIRNAIEGSKRLQELIKDLLLYSRIGVKEKSFIPVDCNEVIRIVLENLKGNIEEGNAIITNDPLPTILGIRTEFIQLFQNLIENALKYRGKETPQISISVEEGEGEWLFAVKDNGLGINPKNMERIFVIFQRLHTKEEFSGTGVGLAICKKIVLRLGGRIWVESGENQGSTFHFSAPIKEIETAKT